MNNLSKYTETLDLIETHIGKLRITTDQVAIQASSTLLSVVLDHAQGIKLCIEKSAYPSAFALLRIIFETYIRALWILKCANKEQLDEYINNDKVISKNGKKLYFGDMLLQVESAHQLPKYFSEIKKTIWPGLNSLTHSGSIQLYRNFNGKSIIHRYDNEHIDEAIDFATMLSCMAFAGLCDLATNLDSSNEINELMEFVFSWAFTEK